MVQAAAHNGQKTSYTAVVSAHSLSTDRARLRVRWSQLFLLCALIVLLAIYAVVERWRAVAGALVLIDLLAVWFNTPITYDPRSIPLSATRRKGAVPTS